MLPQMQLHVNVTPMTFSDSIAPNTSYRKGTTFGIKRKIIGGISSKIKPRKISPAGAFILLANHLNGTLGRGTFYCAILCLTLGCY